MMTLDLKRIDGTYGPAFDVHGHPIGRLNGLVPVRRYLIPENPLGLGYEDGGLAGLGEDPSGGSGEETPNSATGASEVPLGFFGGQAAPTFFGGQALNVTQTPLTVDDLNAFKAQNASSTPKPQTFSDWFIQHQQLVLILGGCGLLIIALESGGRRR